MSAPTLRDVMIEAMKRVLISKGFKQDYYGNWVKDASARNAGEPLFIRYKFNAQVVRREIKTTEDWRPSRSAYYKDVTIENNTIQGLKPGGT